MGRIAFALLVLLASFPSVARDYQLSSSATNADLPTCSSNNWQQTVAGGIRTYHCANGSVSLSSGDNITATSQAILSADAGFSLAGSNTIGSATTVVDLVSSYGSTTWQGNGNRLFGNYQAANTPVTLNNVDIQGAVTTGGAIAIQGGSVSGDVRSNNHGIRLENTNVQGAVFAIGNILVDGSSVSGSIETPNNALTITDSTITGSLTANGDIIVTRSDVSGNITTPNNALTVTDSTITGSLTANGDIIVTRSDVSGNITTPNNSVTMNDANVVGSVSANGNVVIDNTSVTGNLTSTNNQVTLNNGSYVLGDVTAGQPNWGIVNINGGSVVEGNCLYNSVPANACGASALPSAVALYHLEEQVWDGSANEVLDASGNALHGRAVNGAVTALVTPALPTLNNLGTCGYGVFDKSSNQYLEIPDSPLLDFEETLTVSAWVYPKDYPNSGLMSIVSKDGNYEFHLDNSGRVYWYWEIQGGGYDVLTSTKSIPKNQWSQITIRYNKSGAPAKQSIFINGQLDRSSNRNDTLATNNRPLQIGQDQNFAGRAFDGFIDEVQIFSQALSNAQILQLYRQRHPCGSGPTLQCFNDDFQSQPLDQQWRVFSSSGSFTPSTVIVNGNNSRLRLTEAAQNQATASTFQRIFPAANNRVEVEFDYFAYGGNGADGVAIVFSDASVTPQVGAFGGPLGYGYKVNEQKPGFAGGWLGIGLDEYGNYSIEGGGNGPGRRKQSVALRGSGSGYSGYNYLAGTCNNGTINTNGDCLSPDIDDNDGNPLHRYRIVIDSTQAGTSFVTVSRRVGSGSWVDLIESINILNLSGQSAVPQELLLSITGSTGSSTNNHEIDNFEVCALNSRPVGEQINHFRISLPAQGLTCAASNVSVTACADENCNNLFTDPVIAYLTPNSLPSATGGWVNGSTISFSNGVGNTQLRRNSAGNITVDVSGSVPTSVSFNNTLCSLNGNAGPFLASNCTVNFVDSGFILDVPDAYANKPVPASLSAVRKDNVTEKCTPTFASVTKSVKFWSDYVSPSVGQINNAAQARINTTNIATSEESSKAIVLNFDAQGTANFTLNYPEAGQLELNAKLQATDDDQDLVMHGSAQFVRVPRALVVTAKNGANLGACTTQDINCDVFAKAGESFDLDIRGVAWQSDADSNFADNPVTQNYQHAAIELDHSLIAPVSGSEGSLGLASHDHPLTNGGVSTAAQSISEVGVFSFSASAPKAYLGLNLTNSGLEIADGSTGPIGRFIPAYFSPSSVVTSLQAECEVTSPNDESFSYLGQPFGYKDNPGIYLHPRSASGSETVNYFDSAWWRYDGQWDNRTYNDLVHGLSISFDKDATSVNRINVGDSRIELLGEELIYQKPPQPIVPFKSKLDLILLASDLTDLDGVCYRETASSPCMDYTIADIDNKMKLHWGKLVIHDTNGPETNPLSQKVEAQYFSGGIFRTNSNDSCTQLPALTPSSFSSDNFSVNQAGLLPTVVVTYENQTNGPLLLDKGLSALDYSAPGLGNRGLIKALLDLETHGLPWLRTYHQQSLSWQKSAVGLAQFGFYSGSNRVIWWRESN